jgi:hypothetical protein
LIWAEYFSKPRGSAVYLEGNSRGVSRLLMT